MRRTTKPFSYFYSRLKRVLRMVGAGRMTDEVQKKLDEIEDVRRKIKAKVSESLEALTDIEDELNDAKTRQVERMRKDSRVDESIVEQVKGEGE